MEKQKQTKLKKKYVRQRHEWINNNNMISLAPFFLSSDEGKTLQVETPQYNAWVLTGILSKLLEKFQSVTAIDGQVSRLNDETEWPDWFVSVYNIIQSRSNAINWYTLIPDAGIVRLTPNQQTDLFNKDPEIIATVAVQLQSHIDMRDREGWFIKCGSCSTKHDYPPQRVFSGLEAIKHLLGSSDVLKRLSNGTAQCIMIRPWCDDISDNTELRVFVRTCKVVGVSQQACYDRCIPSLSTLDPDEVIAAAQDCYDNIRNSLPIEKRFDYECSFDAYVKKTGKEGKRFTIHLIEINSEGFGWGPVGSSLFNWKSDPPPEPDQSPIFYVTGTY